jgi:transcriptional regulator with XRE-family HTH domain
MGSVGEYLAEQRRHAQLSLRQLSDLAGVSNPYLSQIERGLRKPSADVLQQLAKAVPTAPAGCPEWSTPCCSTPR